MATVHSTPSFARDIRPLFREDDRESMKFAFDLWDYLSWLLGLSVPKQAFRSWLSRSLLLPTTSDLLKDPCLPNG